MGKFKIANGIVGEYFPGGTEINNYAHIASSDFKVPPHIMHDTITRMFGMGFNGGGSPLSAMLSMFPKVEIDDTEWEWKMSVPPPTARTMERLEPAGMVGKFKQPFKLKLNMGVFKVGEVLCPGVTERGYQVRVDSPAVQHGDGYVYTVRLMNTDPNNFVPDRYLVPNTPWVSAYTVYGDGSSGGSGLRTDGRILMKDHLGCCRMKQDLTYLAGSAKIALDLKGRDGLYRMYCTQAEMELMQEFAQMKERMLFLGQDAGGILDENGNPVRGLTSIREKLRDSNREIYNHLSGSLLTDFMMHALAGNIKAKQHRHILCCSGTAGMMNFHKAMVKELGDNGFTRTDVNVRKISSDYHQNALAVGSQVVRYDLPMNITVEMMHMPFYDDPRMNFERDPRTGYLLESMRMTFFDITGDSSMAPNIQLVSKKGAQVFTVVNGVFGPDGATPPGQAAHTGSYYTYVLEDHIGVHIHDISRCGELIYAAS